MVFLVMDKLKVIGFQGYSIDNMFHSRGRALGDEKIDLDEKGFFALLRNSWKRFGTDEIKHTSLRIKIGQGIFMKTTTDNNGYYWVNEPLEQLSRHVNDEGWLPFEVSFESEISGRTIVSNNRFPCKMLIPCRKLNMEL